MKIFVALIFTLVFFFSFLENSLALTKQRLIMNGNQVALLNGKMKILTTRGNTPHDPTGASCVRFQKKYPKTNCISYDIVKSDGSYAIVVRDEMNGQTRVSKSIFIYDLNRKKFVDATKQFDTTFRVGGFQNYALRMEGENIFLKVWIADQSRKYVREQGFVTPEECNEGAPDQCHSLEKKFGLHEETWLKFLKNLGILRK